MRGRSVPDFNPYRELERFDTLWKLKEGMGDLPLRLMGMILTAIRYSGEALAKKRRRERSPMPT